MYLICWSSVNRTRSSSTRIHGSVRMHEEGPRLTLAGLLEADDGLEAERQEEGEVELGRQS